jgi:diacylglycerol kinase family enzyme
LGKARKRSTSASAADATTIVIVNPNSCSGLTGKNWDSLYASIRQILGENLKVVRSKRPGDGTVIARKYLKRGFRSIVAIGGDGTLNEVANGFFEEHAVPGGPAVGRAPRLADVASLKAVNPDAVMAVVPCGTRNVLAKSLGLPEGVVECCSVFSSGAPKKIDVIVADVTSADNSTTTTSTTATARRVLLNAAEIGLGAEIIDRSKKVRKAVNSRLLSTVAGIIATVPMYQSNMCEILLGTGRGRRKIVTNMTMAMVSNGKFLGGGFKAAPKADMADGLLDVVVLKDSGSLKVLDELVNMKEGDYSEEDKVFYYQARKVTIRSKERNVTVTVDGEPIGMLPATFEVLPNALTIKM